MMYRVVHHTADTTQGDQFEKTQAYHNAGAGGKWKKGYGIQYHRFIEKDGTIIFAKAYDKVTWHSGSTAWNVKSVAWCLAGNFMKEEPTEAQLKALFEIWKAENFPPLVGHNEIRPLPTQCPAFDFREALDSLRLGDLAKRLRIATSALQRVKGLRLASLLRFIDRVKRIITS